MKFLDAARIGRRLRGGLFLNWTLPVKFVRLVVEKGCFGVMLVMHKRIWFAMIYPPELSYLNIVEAANGQPCIVDNGRKIF